MLQFISSGKVITFHHSRIDEVTKFS